MKCELCGLKEEVELVYVKHVGLLCRKCYGELVLSGKVLFRE